MGNLSRTPLQQDEALVDEALATLPRPHDVLDVTYEPGEDADGEPAIWIWLITPKDVNPRPDRIERLTRYSIEIRDWLLDRGVHHWPYVRIHHYAPRAVGPQYVTGSMIC